MSCPSALGTWCHLCLSVCARFVCGARARVPDMYNNRGCLRGGGCRGGPHARTCGPLTTGLWRAPLGLARKELLRPLSAAGEGGVEPPLRSLSASPRPLCRETQVVEEVVLVGRRTVPMAPLRQSRSWRRHVLPGRPARGLR